MTDLAVYFEHPAWFEPLFRLLDARGVSWAPIPIQDHIFDASDLTPPAPVVLSRLAMSSFLRQDEHAIFYSKAVLAHWELAGARVINGAGVLAIDANKSRQLTLIRSLGLNIPRTRVVHRREDLMRAAQGLRFPVMVKANIGGSGAGMVRYDTPEDLAMWADDGTTPVGIDGVAMVQEYVPARYERVIRCEVLDHKFLYAIALNGAGSTFDLCPADVCMTDKPTITIEAFDPPPEIIRAVEAISRAAGLDVGGIEYMVDDRDGEVLFYDINALSNFVANPLEVLGYDPHETFVDYLQAQIAAHVRVAA
jgi:glutathione synthase/RimK-type ligase-like ATP-grasp enzyme